LDDETANVMETVHRTAVSSCEQRNRNRHEMGQRQALACLLKYAQCVHTGRRARLTHVSSLSMYWFLTASNVAIHMEGGQPQQMGTKKDGIGSTEFGTERTGKGRKEELQRVPRIHRSIELGKSACDLLKVRQQYLLRRWYIISRLRSVSPAEGPWCECTERTRVSPVHHFNPRAVSSRTAVKLIAWHLLWLKMAAFALVPGLRPGARRSDLCVWQKRCFWDHTMTSSALRCRSIAFALGDMYHYAALRIDWC
jgi:hypothetical protein